MYYLDTSVLVALYLPERKSEEIQRFVRSLEKAALSSLCEAEFYSAVSRRIRMREIARKDGHRVLSQFQLHMKNRVFESYPVMQKEYNIARDWIGNFGMPLRTLDALHLAVVFANSLDFVTADFACAKSARLIGIHTEEI